MRSALALALLLAAGCVGRRMDAWIGHPEHELLAHWGAPDIRLEHRDGSRVLRWTRDWIDGDTHTCRKSFTIGRDGRVSAWTVSDCDVWTNVPSAPRSR
jgi:hypothetical protein